MPLEYRVPLKDTGYNLNTSIQPIDNGEPSNEDTYRRPSENLRTRSEDIRAHFDALEAVVASDRGLTVMAAKDTYVTWNSGAGTFTIDDNAPSPNDRDMWIVPLLGTATAAGGTAIPARWAYTETGNGFWVDVNQDPYNELRDFGDTPLDGTRSGANNVFFKLIQGVPGTVNVYTEGDTDGSLTYPEDGPVTVVIEYDPATSTFNDIVAAIQSTVDPKVQSYLDYTHATVIGTGSTLVTGTIDEPQRIYDGALGTYPNTSRGAVDAQSIKITPSMWTAFWSTYTSLAEGDMVVANFTDAKDRLNNKATSDMTNMLVKVDVNSARTANRQVVPVCKVFGGRLYFVNGRSFDDGEPGKLVSDPGAVESDAGDFAKHVAGTDLKHADSAITSADISGSPQSLNGVQVRGQLTAMLSHYNSHVGAGTQDKHTDDVVTAAAKTGSPRSLTGPATVNAQLVELLGFYNNHVATSGSTDKHGYEDLLASSRPSVTVGTDADFADYDEMQLAINAIAATGGIIHVQPGTNSWIVNNSATSIDKPIDIIGQGEVIWQNAGANPLVQFTTATNLNAPVRFHNIHFRNNTTTGSPGSAIISEDLGAQSAALEFYDCVFDRPAHADSTAMLEMGSDTTTLVMRRCTLSCDDYTTVAPAIALGVACESLVDIKDCAFIGFAQIINNVSTASGVILKFAHNAGLDAGQSSGTAMTHLFGTTGGGTYASFEVRDSIFFPGSGANSGGLADVTSSFSRISGNIVSLAPTGGTSEHIIDVTALSSDISRNTIDSGVAAGAIKATSGSIDKNTIDSTAGSGGAVIYMGGDDMRVTNNRVLASGDCDFGIDCNSNDAVVAHNVISMTHASFSGDVIDVVGDRVLVEGNNIDTTSNVTVIIDVDGSDARIIGNRCGLSDNGGIRITGTSSNPTIHGNIVTMNSGGTAIDCSNPVDAPNIVGNTVTGATTGINSDTTSGVGGVIADNTISVTGASAKGIDTDNPYIVIDGNRIAMGGGATTVGVTATANNARISNNKISDVFKGIQCGATLFNIDGNEVLEVLNIDASIGIDVSQAGATSVKGSVNNNLITRVPGGVKTNSYSIDLGNVTDCAVAGNSIWVATDFAGAGANAAGMNVAGAVKIGLGGVGDTTPSQNQY